MKPTFLIAAVAGLLVLTGCARNQVEPQYPPKELSSFEERVELTSAWSQRVGRGLGRAAYPIAPARDGDALFAADERGRLAAFDADDGDRRWQVDLEVPVSSALTAVAGDIYLGTRNGEVPVSYTHLTLPSTLCTTSSCWLGCGAARISLGTRARQRTLPLRWLRASTSPLRVPR